MKIVISDKRNNDGGYGYISEAGLWIDIEIVPDDDPRPSIFEHESKSPKA